MGAGLHKGWVVHLSTIGREMQVHWIIILSKHELRGLIMTQGRLESERNSVLCGGVDAEASRTCLVICKQVTMQARCMSICTNEQGRRRGREHREVGGREWEEKREDLIRVNLQCPVPNS